MAEADSNAPARFAIGAWTFLPAENELRRGAARRRLEHRAARTLELLCRRRGEMVSRETIVSEIWNGRLVSPNSLSIVVSDLREALGDDARAPRYIETIAKSGYKLLDPAPGDAAAPPPAGAGRRLILVAAFGFALVAFALAAAWAFRPAPRLTLIVPAVANETGNPRLDPLARASNEVLIAAAGRIVGTEVVRGADAAAAGDGRRLLVSGRLVMWSGRPTLMLNATDPANGRIVWQGIGGAGENAIPPAVDAAMRDLGAHLPA